MKKRPLFRPFFGRGYADKWNMRQFVSLKRVTYCLFFKIISTQKTVGTASAITHRVNENDKQKI